MHPRRPLPAARPRRVALAGALAIAVCVCAAALAACGGPSGGSPTAAASPSSAAAASPSATVGDAPTPVPSPQITSGAPPKGAIEAVRSFWTLLGEGKLAQAKATVVAPGAPIMQWDDGSIASARFVRVASQSVGLAPIDGATVEFSVDVWIEQAATAPNVWGDPSVHQLFEQVVRMSDGTWMMWDSGTGP